MTSIVEVSEAIIERVRPVVPDWETFWFEPSPIPLPAICVRPDPGKFADYQQVTGSYTRWYLRLAFYATAVDQDASRLTMGELTDPRGPLITRLLSEDIDDDLHRLCAQDVQVTTGRGWDVARRNRSRFLYADLGVVCGSN